MPHQEFFATMGVFTVILALVVLLIAVLFCLSLYSAMKKVPENKRVFPAWFCWMMLVPLANIVFEWIMIPFGLPKTFKAHLPKNAAAQAKAGTLFGVGLAMMILAMCSIIPYLNFLTGPAAIILFIIYWVKVVSFKKRFLLKKK